MARKEPDEFKLQPDAALVLPDKTPNVLSVLNIGALIEKAIDAKSAVDIIERLRTMWLDEQARQAERAFNEAMSAFQAECKPILKEKSVPDRSGKTAYKYAPVEAIEVQIRPLLREHGFSHTFDTDTASEQGWVIAKCIVTHRDGHSRTSTAKFPLGTKTPLMSDTQVYAAALTFANRRALTNAYGLVLAGEDLDGQGKIKPAGPSTLAADDVTKQDLVKELWSALKTIRGLEQNWNAANQWMWNEEILRSEPEEAAPNLSTERLREVIAAVKKVLR